MLPILTTFIQNTYQFHRNYQHLHKVATQQKDAPLSSAGDTKETSTVIQGMYMYSVVIIN